MKIVLSGNSGLCIYKFRFELCEKLLEEGHEVIVISPRDQFVYNLIKLGCKYVEVPMDSKGTNPFNDLKLLKTYKRLFKSIKPNVVLGFTIKPNIYGAWACKKLKVPFIANITGLGTAVENGGLIQKITVILYKIAFKRIKTVFFQNEENMQFFINKKIAVKKHKLLPGSGVNLKKFAYIDYPNFEPTTFTFAARVMKEKGIDNYLQAAEIIKSKYPFVQFNVCGMCDEYYKGVLSSYEQKGIIKYHGLVSEMLEIYKNTHCLVHPTYYPEGISNVLIESLAMGRPIITTNRSGCREVVDDNVNGFIVNEKDTDDLVLKLGKFLSLSYEERKALGLNGRKKVENTFDRNIVINAYLKELLDLL